MRILFIAPLPPPMNGHALAAKVFLDDLATTHAVEVVDLSVGSRGDGSVTLRRIAEVVKVLKGVLLKQRRADAIYLTISESVAGNIKDLVIYALCAAKLPRMYIHLHGGTIRTELFDRHPLLRNLNARFIRKLAGIIISGESHANIFVDMIDPRRIHISANFAQDHLFVSERAIADKFAAAGRLRVLYISNMITMKGYDELADAYLSLDGAARHRIGIDFAGRFQSEGERRRFLDKIAGVDGIRYHGVVDEAQKQQLFAAAHVFCLPTAFLEGQPVSILEAYASGCVVLTTGQSGIRDVFTHGVNGWEVQAKSPQSIAAALKALSGEFAGSLPGIALANRRLADSRYRTNSYNSRLRDIVEGSAAAP